MMTRAALTLCLLICLALGVPAAAQEAQTIQAPAPQSMVTEVLTPDYLSPSELVGFLGTVTSGGVRYFFCDVMAQSRPVQVRFNDAANVVMLSGAPEDVAVAKDLVTSADVPPRQIIIETQIIEIDREQLDDLGIDWEDLLESSNLTIAHNYRRAKTERDQKSDGHESQSTITQTDRTTQLSGSLRLDRFINILAQSGAGTIHSAPRIVTINNRPAQILDGERVTYVNRYSSYTNLFETQTMDAGLSLYAVPSIGESGYITLDITAELTTLGQSVSGSPAKRGQILENTAVIKDGETFLLGGLNRSVDYVTKRRFPLLGHILPFLFSRQITTRTNYEVFVLLTPRVIDLEPQELDGRLRGFLDQQGGTP